MAPTCPSLLLHLHHLSLVNDCKPAQHAEKLQNSMGGGGGGEWAYALHAWERVHKHFIALITLQEQCHKIFGSGVLQSVHVHPFLLS
jgi:hypothetical protein